MSIQSEIDRLQTAKNSIREKMEQLGVSVPVNAALDSYPLYMAGLPSGDMQSSVYDPQGKNTDVFQYADEKNAATLKGAKEYTDEKLANCYISFTDETGAPTSEPYIHWDTPD